MNFPKKKIQFYFPHKLALHTIYFDHNDHNVYQYLPPCMATLIMSRIEPIVEIEKQKSNS